MVGFSSLLSLDTVLENLPSQAISVQLGFSSITKCQFQCDSQVHAFDFIPQSESQSEILSRIDNFVSRLEIGFKPVRWTELCHVEGRDKAYFIDENDLIDVNVSTPDGSTKKYRCTIATLTGDIISESLPTSTEPAFGYQLVSESKGALHANDSLSKIVARGTKEVIIFTLCKIKFWREPAVGRVLHIELNMKLPRIEDVLGALYYNDPELCVSDVMRFASEVLTLPEVVLNVSIFHVDQWHSIDLATNLSQFPDTVRIFITRKSPISRLPADRAVAFQLNVFMPMRPADRTHECSGAHFALPDARLIEVLPYVADIMSVNEVELVHMFEDGNGALHPCEDATLDFSILPINYSIRVQLKIPDQLPKPPTPPPPEQTYTLSLTYGDSTVPFQFPTIHYPIGPAIICAKGHFGISVFTELVSDGDVLADESDSTSTLAELFEMYDPATSRYELKVKHA